MTVFSRIATVLFIIALPVFLITANVRFLSGEIRFYERGIREHNADAVTGVPRDQLNAAAQDIINYFEDDAETLRIVVTEGGEETSLFDARETLHMEDVKRLMRFIFRLNELSLAFILTYVAATVLWSGERSVARLARESLAAIGVGLAALLVVGLFALVSFDATWDKFHEIVFPNDLWRLDPDTDRLIQMFPEPFWEESAYIAGAMTLAEVTLITVISVAYLYFRRAPGDPLAAAAAAGTSPPPSAFEGGELETAVFEEAAGEEFGDQFTAGEFEDAPGPDDHPPGDPQAEN